MENTLFYIENINDSNFSENLHYQSIFYLRNKLYPFVFGKEEDAKHIDLKRNSKNLNIIFFKIYLIYMFIKKNHKLMHLNS